MFAEDVSQFFSDDDFTVKAKFGTETRDVLFDTPDDIIADGRVISAHYVITYKTGWFDGMAYGDTITVDGTVYTVNTVTAAQDGKLTDAHLSKT